MAMKVWSICAITVFLLVAVCSSSRDLTIKVGQKRNVARTWCIAKPGLSQDQLVAAVSKYCGEAGVDCTAVKPGGDCYGNILEDRVSYILDFYYYVHNKVKPYCPLEYGFYTVNDPSTGSCIFP